MLTLTGNGRLTRDPQLRATNSGDPVTTVSVASDRRDRDADPVYVELVLWGKQAQAAVEHLVTGQAVAFSGRFEPRDYQTRDGKDRVGFEVHQVTLEYGAKPRRDVDPDPAHADDPGACAADDPDPAA